MYNYPIGSFDGVRSCRSRLASSVLLVNTLSLTYPAPFILEALLCTLAKLLSRQDLRRWGRIEWLIVNLWV